MLLYRTEDERREAVTAWVRRGLDLGEKVVYSEGDVPPQRSLFTILESRGVDAASLASEGRLEVLPLDEFFPAKGQDRIVDRALAEGFASVRLSSEADAALTILSPDGYHKIEWNLDRMCRTQPVSAMCQYARSKTFGDAPRDAVAIHLTGVRESEFGTFPDEHGLALRGEIDLSNADVLAAAVEVATRPEEQVVCLDLGGLEFLDAAGCRVLVTGSANFRRTGGLMLLVAPQPQVERTMRLLGLDELPGVEIVGAEP